MSITFCFNQVFFNFFSKKVLFNYEKKNALLTHDRHYITLIICDLAKMINHH